MSYLANTSKGTPSAEYRSPDDFVATYTSSTTITLTGIPFTPISVQVIYIRKITTGGVATTYVNGLGGVSLTISGVVVTIAGAGTPFASGDTYEVGINGQKKAYDANLDVNKDVVQNPTWARYTAKEELISSAQTLTTSFVDMGSEIDMQGYNQLALWLTVDINGGHDIQIRLLHKHTSGGAEEYREIYLGTPANNVTKINLNDYELATDADQLFKINIPVSATSPYIQVQVKMDADSGEDAQIDAAYITKAYAA